MTKPENLNKRNIITTYGDERKVTNYGITRNLIAKRKNDPRLMWHPPYRQTAMIAVSPALHQTICSRITGN